LKLFDGAVRNGDHLFFTLSEGMIEVKRRRTMGRGSGRPLKIRNSKSEIRIIGRARRAIFLGAFIAPTLFEFLISNFEFNHCFDGGMR
jgi:hypothetical protein